MDPLTYSDEELKNHLRRTLSKSSALRTRRTLVLRLAILTLVIAAGGSVSATLLSSTGKAHPFSAPTVVSGHMSYLVPDAQHIVITGRVVFTSTSLESATNVTSGTFSLYLPAGRYRVTGTADQPYRARCNGPVLTIGKHQTHAKESLACRPIA